MKIPKVKTNHLLKDSDFNRKEILALFEFTEKLKKKQKKSEKHKLLKGKTLGMIFEKSSTRTRVSFETGIYQLGGHGLFLSKNDIQIGRGETIPDTARVLSRYINGIMIRTFEQSKIEELAKYSSVPVINALTDDFHPCQALADYFTIYERTKKLKKVKLCYIGDGNNMANSLLIMGAILGVDVAIAAPDTHSISSEIMNEAKELAEESGSLLIVTPDIAKAAEGADYLYTDVWASMGQESESEKRKIIFKDYKITKSLIDTHCPNALVMHCLPAHRGEEIDADVIESKQSIVFDEAENRLHVQKAVMSILMNKNK